MFAPSVLDARADADLVRSAGEDASCDGQAVAATRHEAVAPRIDALPTVERSQRTAMRILDLIGALLLALVAMPLTVVVACAVKLTSDGPIFFRQERIGYGFESFTVWKFRTMIDGTHRSVIDDPDEYRRYVENDFKLPGTDARITPVGTFLRKTSLDELPQLINVIRGEMSLVGARPIERGQLEMRSLYDQALYVLHRPGLTGVWQVEGRSGLNGDDRIELDRACLEGWSLRTNLMLLIRTPRAVIGGAGAH